MLSSFRSLTAPSGPVWKIKHFTDYCKPSSKQQQQHAALSSNTSSLTSPPRALTLPPIPPMMQGYTSAPVCFCPGDVTLRVTIDFMGKAIAAQSAERPHICMHPLTEDVGRQRPPSHVREPYISMSSTTRQHCFNLVQPLKSE